MQKFGLLTYGTDNLGDDVQSLAAKQYLPQVDEHLDRDHLSAHASGDPIRVIMNGWWLHSGTDWPPPERVDPLLLSFHASKHARPLLTQERSLEYLRKHGPVGCRDQSTLELFESHDVPCYYSGCLTLTHQRRDVPKDGSIVFSDPFGHDKNYRFFQHGDDYYDATLKKLCRTVPENAIHTTNVIETNLSPQARLDLAEEHLRLFCRAKLVVTCRIHCALPCLAMGTPVLFIQPRRGSDMAFGGLVGFLRSHLHRSSLQDKRFPGLVELMNACKIQEVEKGEIDPIDLDAIDSNPKPIDPIANPLREACQNFIQSGVRPNPKTD